MRTWILGLAAMQAGFWMAVLPACSTVPNQPAPTVSSTRGTTLVRAARVAAVREFSGAGTGASASGPASRHVQASRLQEVSVRFEDGEMHRYRVQSSLNFQIGEQVTVSDTHGTVRIDR